MQSSHFYTLGLVAAALVVVTSASNQTDVDPVIAHGACVTSCNDEQLKLVSSKLIPVEAPPLYCKPLCEPILSGGAALDVYVPVRGDQCLENAPILSCAGGEGENVCLVQPGSIFGKCVDPKSLLPRMTTESGAFVFSGKEMYFRTELQAPVTSVSGLLADIEGVRQDLNTARSDLDGRLKDLKDEVDTSVARDIASLRSDLSALEGSLKRADANLLSTVQGEIRQMKNGYDMQIKQLNDRVKQAFDRINNQDKRITSGRTVANNALSTAASAKASLNKVTIGVRSAGICNGNYIRYYVNGKTRNVPRVSSGYGSRNWLRGINIVKLDPNQEDPNKVLDTTRYNFDTCCGGGAIHPNNENARLQKFLDSLPNGQWIAVGIHDEGVANLRTESRARFAQFGAKFIMGHIRYRESWAMIGCKGCPQGSAIEDHGGHNSPGCGGGGRPSKTVKKTFAIGLQAWRNAAETEVMQSLAYPRAQRRVFFNYDGCRDRECTSRRFTFYKANDDTILDIKWYDNFRCAGGSGRSCRWDVMIDGQMCARDSSIGTGPIRYDIYNHQNNHLPATVQGYCWQLANGRTLAKGIHTFSVFERGSPQHNHGSPVLGWNWSNQSPGGNSRTRGGTYTSITVREVS